MKTCTVVYHFGFNGKENDKEGMGGGGSSTFESFINVNGKNANNDSSVKSVKLLINANPKYSVCVLGSANTNNASGDYDNQGLSENRANTTISKLREGADAIPSSKILNNEGLGSNQSRTGSTPQGTLELNRNATIQFTIPKAK